MKIKTIKLKNVCLIIFSFLIVSSCTIQKKLHSNGYHVEWKGFNKKTQSNKQETFEDLYIEKKELQKAPDKSEFDSIDFKSVTVESLPEEKSIVFKKRMLDKPIKVKDSKPVFYKKTPEKNAKTYYRSSIDATTCAFLAHFGMLILVLGISMLSITGSDVVIAYMFLVMGLLFIGISVLLGMRAIMHYNYGNLPLFAQITLIGYSILFFIVVAILISSN